MTAQTIKLNITQINTTHRKQTQRRTEGIETDHKAFMASANSPLVSGIAPASLPCLLLQTDHLHSWRQETHPLYQELPYFFDLQTALLHEKICVEMFINCANVNV